MHSLIRISILIMSILSGVSFVNKKWLANALVAGTNFARQETMMKMAFSTNRFSAKGYSLKSTKLRPLVKGKIVSVQKAGLISEPPKASPVYIVRPASPEPAAALEPEPESPTETHQEKSNGPQVLSAYPESLLPKDITSWSGKVKDFKKLIVYEDDDVLVLFKPAGIMTQPGEETETKDAKNPSLSSSAPSTSSVKQENIIVKNKRYIFPDIDILSLAEQYVVKERKKIEESKPKIRSRRKRDHPYFRSMAKPVASKPFTVGLVHRLDRPASGLMILAKTPEALRILNSQFVRQKVIKRYLCVVNGRLEAPETCVDYLLKKNADVATVIRNPYRKSSSKNKKDAVGKDKNSPPQEKAASIDDFSLEGQEQENDQEKQDPNLRGDVMRAELSYTPLHVTEYTVRKKWVNANTTASAAAVNSKKNNNNKNKSKRVVEAKKEPEQETIVKVMDDGYVETKAYQTLLDVTLITGRRHQIRAQLSHRQHPIVGDLKYSAPQSFNERDISLHAYYLSFYHPTTRRRIIFRMKAPRIWAKRFGPDVAAKIEELASQPVEEVRKKVETKDETDKAENTPDLTPHEEQQAHKL